MSSVQVLLTTLQDSESWPNGSCRAVLVELTSLCRHEDLKSAILSTGIDIILSVAQDRQSDSMDVMLELLVTLALENRGAKVILAQRGVLQLAQSALEVCFVKKASKRRTRCVKLALELMDLLNATEISQDPTQQRLLVEQITRVLSNLNEDPSILLHATDVLGCMIEANGANIQLVCTFDGIQTLVYLLGLASDKMDLKRSVCEVLLLMSEHPDTVQAMATDQTVRSLGQCLREKSPGRDVEYVVVRLLLSLLLHAPVHGMIVHQNLTGLLFQVIERNCNVLQVTRATCSILDGVAQFARECKLDLSSFVNDVSCQGKILIQAATNHVHDSHLVSSIFHFFVNVSYNPVDLPNLINSSVIEGLLSLYITSGGSGHLSVLADCIVQVISALSRSTIETISFIDADNTLPSMFLCLRANRENLKFASQVFALLSKHWRAQPKSAHSVTGFVGIAIDMIHRASNCWKNEMIEMYNFVRVMLLSKDGNEVVQSCGGNMLLEALRWQLLARGTEERSTMCSKAINIDDASSSGFSDLEQIVRCVSTMLSALNESDQRDPRESCVITRSTIDHMVEQRSGDKEYQEYVFTVLRKEQICLFKVCSTDNIEGYLSESRHYDLNTSATERQTQRHDSVFCLDHVHANEPICSQAEKLLIRNNQIQAKIITKQSVENIGEVECNANFAKSEPDEVKEGTEDGNEDENDDGSEDDSDGDDKAIIAQEDLFVADTNTGADYFNSTPSEEQIRSKREHLAGLNCFQAHPNLNLVDSHNSIEFQDKSYFLVDSIGIKHPKHPLKHLQYLKDFNIQDEDGLIRDEPGYLEPFKSSSPEQTCSFVEKAIARRNLFMLADVNSRAKIVYQNFIHLERRQPGSSNNDSDNVELNASQTPSWGNYPYDVPENSQAFPNQQSSLTFDSRFESGNLQRAIQIGEFEYDLVLQQDVNTTGHMQWFYFAVSNVQATNYRFNIVNLCKPDSLFNQGLQPVVYSVKDAKLKRKGWLRCGTDIYYFQNPFSRMQKSANMDTLANNELAASPAPSTATYFTLTFTLNFSNADDTYLIAHSYPYTLTDNQLHMKQLSHRAGKRIHRILRRTVLCQTLGGRDCDLLTISDFTASSAELKARRAVVLTSRVHPGETQSSWMMRGIIDFLLSDSDVARVLRRLFVFRVVPLLNPDGVFNGNSRCALSSCDLNRQWQCPSKIKHPTIFHAKQLIMTESAERGIVFFCDIHGHSRKKNVFMYGCDTKKRPNPKARAFAKILASQETARSYVSFPDCSFKVSRDKETTARVVFADETKLSWSFTLEASFSGANFGPLQGMHFNTKHMHNVGTSLCEALFDACILDINVRQRLGSLVADYSFSLPSYAESYLREAVNISCISGMTGTNQELDLTPRKPNATAGTEPKSKSKPIRRPSVRSVPTGEKRVPQACAPGKLSHKGSRLFRQNSSAAVKKPHLETQAGFTVIVKCEDDFACPRPKLNGKKMRGKPKKAACRSETTAESENRYIPTLSGYSVQPQDLSSQTRVRESSSADSSTSSASSSNMVAPSVPIPRHSGAVGPPSSSVRRSLTAAQSVDTPMLKAANTTSFSFREVTPLELPQSGDVSQIVLPHPLTDVVSRSPKSKPNSIRFRGAGKQFAAVSPNKKANLKGAMNPESMTSSLAYDQDLLNASALSIRHRSKTSANDYPAVQSRPLKFASPTSSAPYLSFPSVN